MLRPGLQDLLAEARAGLFDVVVAEALDRLSRDQEDVAGIFKRLRFLGIAIHTLAEGEITELHVGLKGTMNALYLKDLAQKTRRGLEGRVRAGRSAGGLCYGYRVAKRTGADGERVRGHREIDAAEAAIVRRIFAEFAAGTSPRTIAKRLNAEGVPGPRGKAWRDTAIRGHRTRGTGIVNNELYVGRLVSESGREVLARLDRAGFDKVRFAWAGGTEPGQPHYYRVHGPTLLIEYDDTQNGANHIHTVYRDLDRDFGGDAMRAHYQGK